MTEEQRQELWRKKIREWRSDYEIDSASPLEIVTDFIRATRQDRDECPYDISWLVEQIKKEI